MNLFFLIVRGLPGSIVVHTRSRSLPPQDKFPEVLDNIYSPRVDNSKKHNVAIVCKFVNHSLTNFLRVDELSKLPEARVNQQACRFVSAGVIGKPEPVHNFSLTGIVSGQGSAMGKIDPIHQQGWG